MRSTQMSVTTDAVELQDIAPRLESRQPPVFKTERGFNINVIALAQEARKNLDNVRVIAIPALVKHRRINTTDSEGPVLSEVGGGSGSEFCQVLADTSGRPISVDNILYLSSDPARASISHGSASVQIGNYIALGWTQRADQVILLYVISAISEFPAHELGRNDDGKMIAKLTCDLVGHYMATWRGPTSQIPSTLMPLYTAASQRMRSDLAMPFYMDIFRMVKVTDDYQAMYDLMQSGDLEVCKEVPTSFMSRVVDEILDIRRVQ